MILVVSQLKERSKVKNPNIRHIQAHTAFFCAFMLLLAYAPLTVMGQLNNVDTLERLTRLTFSGSLLDGNVSRLLLLGRFETFYVNGNIGLSTKTDYQYGTKNRQQSENDVLSYNFIYLRPASKAYPFIMLLAETNHRRRITFRYQVGPGMSVNLINQQKHLLRISLAGTYENTRYNELILNDVSNLLVKSITATRVTGRVYGHFDIISKKLHLLYEIWYQQSITSSTNFRYYYENTLDVPISKHFSFRSTIRYTHENVHISGLKPWDMFWVFGLSFYT